MFQKCVLLLFIFFIISLCDDLENGLKSLSNGDYVTAMNHIKKAYQQDPASALVQFVYATALSDVQEALPLYFKIGSNVSASDSLRSEAYYRCALYYFSWEMEDSAEYWATKAATLKAHAKISHLCARIAFNAGKYEHAEKVWNAMRTAKNDSMVSMIQYYRANALYKQNKFTSAYDAYVNSLKGGQKPWSVASIGGAYLSALHLHDSIRYAPLYREIQRNYPILLESMPLKEKPGSVSPKSVSHPASHKIKTSKASPGKGNIFYTLQVGAFGAVDNARKLVAELKKDFTHITIKKEYAEGMLLHKVRIGLFPSEEAARDYGERLLRPRKLEFRVVVN